MLAGASHAVVDGGKILNYSVLRLSEELRDAKTGTVRRFDTYVAPDLDCFVLKRIGTTTTPSGQSATTTTEVSNIVIGEPNAELFTVPANYTERSPSAIFAESARTEGIECVACASKRAKQLDEQYNKKRASKQP